MNISDLWVGDRLLVISTNQIGTYDGYVDDLYMNVKIGDKILKVKIGDVELLGDEVVSKSFSIEDEETSEKKTKPFSQVVNIIDLHIQELAPDLEGSLPARILDVQVDACRNFLAEMIDQRVLIFHIIHGKGKGVLKREVIHLLKMQDELHFFTEASNGGALDVWFRY